MTRGVAERIGEVRGRIAAAARRAGRDPAEVLLVAVSKSFSAGACLEALSYGITDLGENRAQELRDKMALLEGRGRWHFVGPLQTNKVRVVAGSVVLIHSVDRVTLARAIARRVEQLETMQDVLIEVNVSGEEAKHGVGPRGAIRLAHEAARLDGVSVKGLMTVPPLPTQPEDSRAHYRRLSALRDELSDVVPGATELSMGMTRDFEVAVEEGATIVRVGEAIFGPRDPP
jgi:PLP dependent protein